MGDKRWTSTDIVKMKFKRDKKVVTNQRTDQPTKSLRCADASEIPPKNREKAFLVAHNYKEPRITKGNNPWICFCPKKSKGSPKRGRSHSYEFSKSIKCRYFPWSFGPILCIVSSKTHLDHFKGSIFTTFAIMRNM